MSTGHGCIGLVKSTVRNSYKQATRQLQAILQKVKMSQEIKFQFRFSQCRDESENLSQVQPNDSSEDSPEQ